MSSELSVTSGVSIPPEAVHMLQKQKRVQRITNEHFFRCHPELRTMVSAFISKLLKEKPEDVNLAAERFFMQPDLAKQLGFDGWTRPPTPEPEPEDIYEDEDEDEDEGDWDADEGDGTTGEDVVDLETMLIEIFKEADKDGSGELDFDEFVQVMRTAEVGLTRGELEFLLSEADEDGNGKVTYPEFVPLAVDVIQTMKLKQRVNTDNEEMQETYREIAAEIMGVGPEEVANMVLQAGAASEAGLLSRTQVKALVKAPVLGPLSKQQSNQAAANIDYDGSGMVSAEALAPSLYYIITDVIAKGLAMQDLGEVGAEMTRLCEYLDKESTGFIDTRVLKQELMRFYPYLTRLQVNALISDPDAPTDETGRLAWREYLPKLTAIITRMGDPAALEERAELAQRAEFQPVALMNGNDKAQMNETFNRLFAEADADGSGKLDKDEFRSCMHKTGLNLTEFDIDDLIDQFDHDGDGHISYEEFTNMAYDFLLHAARERAIMTAIMPAIEPEIMY